MKIKLKPQESLKGMYRQSKWILFLPTLILLLVIALSGVLSGNVKISGFPLRGILIFIAFIYWLRHLALFSLNTFLITSDRLIVIIYTGIFQKEVFETPLDRILNISFSVAGFTQSLGGYGQLAVNILGMAKPLIIKNVPKPAQFQDMLWKMHLNRGLAGASNLQTQLPEE